ncbi:hypothetical protein B0H13DRAFT_1580720, partial [Mycena leptocephala]
PRSVFSEPELDATRWFAAKCGVEDLPSVDQVKNHRKKILEQCGTNPTIMEGKLGNVSQFWVWARFLPMREFANPLVRPHIRVFGEDSGNKLGEACQAEKWKLEVAADLAGPMVRHEGKDYFVNEPAL